MNELASEFEEPQTAMVVTQPVTVEAMMLRALDENKVDALEKLLAMREREIDRTAAQAFAQSMVQCQSRIEPVARTADNTQTSSKYAPLEAIYKAAIPIAREHGFALSFGTADSPLPDHVRIVCDVMHRDGHTKQYRTDLAVDNAGIKGNVNKTRIHGEGSTMTYGQRYLTAMIFNVLSFVEKDTDGNRGGSSGSITAEQAADLHTAIVDAGVDEGKFLATYLDPGKAMADLPAVMFKRVMAILRQRIQQRASA